MFGHCLPVLVLADSRRLDTQPRHTAYALLSVWPCMPLSESGCTSSAHEWKPRRLQCWQFFLAAKSEVMFYRLLPVIQQMSDPLFCDQFALLTLASSATDSTVMFGNMRDWSP